MHFALFHELHGLEHHVLSLSRAGLILAGNAFAHARAWLAHIQPLPLHTKQLLLHIQQHPAHISSLSVHSKPHLTHIKLLMVHIKLLLVHAGNAFTCALKLLFIPKIAGVMAHCWNIHIAALLLYALLGISLLSRALCRVLCRQYPQNTAQHFYRRFVNIFYQPYSYTPWYMRPPPEHSKGLCCSL
jgi:hypothetical protein